MPGSYHQDAQPISQAAQHAHVSALPRFQSSIYMPECKMVSKGADSASPRPSNQNSHGFGPVARGNAPTALKVAIYVSFLSVGSIYRSPPKTPLTLTYTY